MPRAKKRAKKKIVLAYSGGLDTSVILRWLIENCSSLNQDLIQLRSQQLSQMKFLMK